jgi:hypothetical protein
MLEKWRRKNIKNGLGFRDNFRSNFTRENGRKRKNVKIKYFGQ